MKRMFSALVAAVLTLQGCIKIETREDLSSFLERRERSRLQCNYEGLVTYKDHDAVARLNQNQLEKISRLVRGLSNYDLASSIGQHMEEDLRDEYSEHGGRIIEKSGNLVLEPVPSHFPEKDKRNNFLFRPSPEDLEAPNLFFYHFHAMQEDCSRFVGPGYLYNPETGEVRGDLLQLRKGIERKGFADELVFTKLPGEKFNATYFGGYREQSQVTMIINLGDWNY